MAEQKKLGRPKKEIDVKIFENCCAIQCTLSEIAGFFECSEDTIQRFCKKEYGKPFCEVYQEKSANGKMSLRRYQFNLAKTNATMAIFLGKQLLGQKDTISMDEKATEAISNIKINIEDNTRGDDKCK